eukprot:TRINITY_DN11935_c0_g1_i2.p2 TRINITY_DN11935_c0_g1~~TRINITY_DN11935_c0_g1_i2.p2  ORF type:complete len:173 (+),score=72.90 TRINITY_DN11935_c0_g1_i2:191-709(+)
MSDFGGAGVDLKPTFGERVLGFVSAGVTAVIAAYLFKGVFGLSTDGDASLLVPVVTAITALILTFCYNNVAFSIRASLMAKREGKVTLGMVSGPTKEAKVKAAKALQNNQAQVTTYESVIYSIFYNNVFFFFLVVLLAFNVLHRSDATFNYIFTVVGSSSLMALFTSNELRK